MTAANTENRNRHIPVREDWLALRQEPALEPDLPIIDPHHHLWDNTSGVYLMPELLVDLKTGHNIISTVFMECRAMYRADGDPDLASVGEVEFVNGVAAMSASGAYGPTRVCEAIIGHANLTRGARSKGILEALMLAGGGRFRGIRYSAVWHAEPSARGSAVSAPEGLLADKGFREGFACLAPLGLTYDAWVYHTQLDELTALARAFPETTIITNHVGGAIGIGPYAGNRDEVLADWRKGIAELAACPNVVMKVGGLGMRLFGFTFQNEATPPSSEELAPAWRPYVEGCIEAFGPSRCMFESNFPVDKGSCSYRVLWNTFKRISAGYSADEKAALFRGTAARAYRMKGEA
jgi:predicted TIM-barrel fold metal-dependent hydrolase